MDDKPMGYSTDSTEKIQILVTNEVIKTRYRPVKEGLLQVLFEKKSWGKNMVWKIKYSRYQCGVIIKSDIHSEMMQNN